MSRTLHIDELQQLMRRSGPALRLFAAQWTTAADDAVQEAFIRLVKKQPPPDNVLAWLYKVVRNQAVSLSRAERRRNKHEKQAGQRPWFEGESRQQVDADELMETLKTLEPEQREVIVARIWGGLGFAELGEVLGTSTATAHRRFQEALELLRARLGIACLNTTTTNN